MLKKLSSLAAGSHSYQSTSGPLQISRKCLNEERQRRHSRGSHSNDSGKDGSQTEADGLRNTMEMLIAENEHLKRLIQERDARTSSVNTAEEREELDALRAEKDEAKKEVARLRLEVESREALIESMKRDGFLKSNEEAQELTRKIGLLEAQLEFECKNHADEIEEKEARLAELEMQLVDAQQKPSVESSTPQESPPSREKQRIVELERKLEAQAAELSRKEADVNKLKAELECTRTMLAGKKEEQSVSSEDEQRARDLSRRVAILEAKLGEEETRRIEAEQALARRQATAEDPVENCKDLEELRREIEEKDTALQGMSKQLLEVSAEKDELEQQLQKLREAPSTPETPRALTSRRSFFGRSKSTALERDALAAQVHSLEEQLQKLSDKRVELERAKVKLERQLAEAVKEVRSARSEKDAIEKRLKEREAALESLRSAHENVEKPLDISQNISLPLPKGRHDTEFDTRAQLMLKDEVIKTLSSRIAYLQFALKEVTAEKEKLLSEPATIALQQQLKETKKELSETSSKYRGIVAQRAELRRQVEALTGKLNDSQRDIEKLRAALEESQTRLNTTADKFKEQNDRYRNLLSTSLTKIDELQEEVSRERNSKILVGKVYRQEMLELRKAAVQTGSVRGDPIRPLSLREPQRLEKAQQPTQPSQGLSKGQSLLSRKQAEARKSTITSTLQTLGSKAERGCPFSNGWPVKLGEPDVPEDFAVIPLCYPLEATPGTSKEARMQPVGSTETSLTVEQRCAAGVLHACVAEEPNDSVCQMKGLLKPQSTSSSALSGRLVFADTEVPTRLQVMNSRQQPERRTEHSLAQLHTERGTLDNQQLPSTQHAQDGPNGQLTQGPKDYEQHEAAGIPKAHALCSENEGDTEGLAHTTYTHGGLPAQQLVQTDAALPIAAAQPARSSSSSAVADACNRMSTDSDAHAPIPFRADVVDSADPSTIDGVTVLRDLKLLQNKKKVLFSPGLGRRGSPEEGDFSELEEDNSVDLS
ncbi:hypothetical protein, conserved [Eimeria tenella]|uniref:Uncharacterized protein n=1 Tax=Eimeria tenella TaxID=5802 RepID=U6KLI8_EIMTE|nr:hypothetical protein, conserved [Eimeria tenella]CDJ38937.1 hypothetical protein, conserved [Eimeria tenella]|eukprot:XP_013229692.1 hypothetical protein, conserved [Eimeria tenella]